MKPLRSSIPTTFANETLKIWNDSVMTAKTKKKKQEKNGTQNKKECNICVVKYIAIQTRTRLKKPLNNRT